jgi:hypothetical protein
LVLILLFIKKLIFLFDLSIGKFLDGRHFTSEAVQSVATDAVVSSIAVKIQATGLFA